MPTSNPNDSLLTLVQRQFAGMNSTSPRQGLSEADFAWLNNVIPLGNGALAVVPNKVSKATVSAETINSFDSCTISGVPFIIAGTSLGNVYAWRTDTWAKSTVITGLSTSGLSYANWQNSQLLILDNAKGLYNWPGTGTAALVSATITGTSMAAYQGQLWVASGRTITYSAPNSYSDFTAASGGGNFIVTDEWLEGSIVALVSAIDYLWIVGNGSASLLSNVQLLTGNITTFTVTNVSNVSGTASPYAVMPFLRSLVLANGHGVDLFYGMTPQKVSSPLDLFFSNVDFTKTISVAVGTIYNQICVHILCYYTPDAKWYIASMANDRWFLIDYGTQSLLTWIAANGTAQAYCTDGTAIYAMAVDTATPITGKIISRFSDAGDPTTTKQVRKMGFEVNVGSLTSASITWTIDTEVGSGASTVYTPTATGFQWARKDAQAQSGQYLGMTIDFTLANSTFEGFMMQFNYMQQWPGRGTIGY